MIDFITNYWQGWLSTILIACVGYLWRRINRIIEEEHLMRNAQQTIMVHEMIRIYNDAISRGGWLTLVEASEAKRLHDIYHRMGWNHTGDIYYEKCMGLPVHDGSEKIEVKQ